MIVGFRTMEHAAGVELAAGPEYFVELNDRFRTHRGDIGAALAHEVTHVLLHRLGLEFPGTRDNEILTDTVTTYLGAGWLLLDAFREDAVSSQKLGYLTPEEFGYVLAKRAFAFDEDPSPWFTSPQAYEAFTAGRKRALRDTRQPPLVAATGRTAAVTRRTGGTPRTVRAPPRPPVLRTPSRAARPDRGSPSRAPPATSASVSRCAARCGPGAGCAGRSWTATPEPYRRPRRPRCLPCHRRTSGGKDRRVAFGADREETRAGAGRTG